MAVQFTSSENGWAVGIDYANKRGVLLHYSDGNWASVASPDVSTDWLLWGVSFASPE